MGYILQLTDATDPKTVGGKAANLSSLLAVGLPVPPGFAITTQAFEEHVRRDPIGGLIEKSIAAIEKGANIEELEVIANEIRRAMQINGPLPVFLRQVVDAHKSLHASELAVRSSATVEDGTSAAWAGQLESYLYVNNELSLCEAIIDCWASLYSPRALSYRLSQGLLRKPVSVAVLVQSMIVAEKSGVAFTVDPVTNDPKVVVIEAVWGDCEQLVSGEITPDNYRFSKDTDLVVDVEIALQTTCRSQGQQLPIPNNRVQSRKLDDGELLRLARLCGQAEEHFGRPQDIEWAYANGTCYILQARPITTFTLGG